MARRTSKRYYLFRYGESGSYGYRLESGKDNREACKMAFGVVYLPSYSGSVRVKFIGTRSPAYVTQKQKQEWYGPNGWKMVGEED